MTPFEVHLRAMLACQAIAMVLAFVRLALGPSLADRAMILDMIAVIGAGLATTAAITYETPFLLDVGILVAAIGFVGTAVFARAIELSAGEGGPR